MTKPKPHGGANSKQRLLSIMAVRRLVGRVEPRVKKDLIGPLTQGPRLSGCLPGVCPAFGWKNGRWSRAGRLQ